MRFCQKLLQSMRIAPTRNAADREENPDFMDNYWTARRIPRLKLFKKNYESLQKEKEEWKQEKEKVYTQVSTLWIEYGRHKYSGQHYSK